MTLLRTVGALLLTGLAATACTAGGAPSTVPVPTPTATPRASASPEPMPSPRETPVRRLVVAGGLGSDGLTVRYQGRDGAIKTLRVEDFQR